MDGFTTADDGSQRLTWMVLQQLVDGFRARHKSSLGLIWMIPMQLMIGFKATDMDGFKSDIQTFRSRIWMVSGPERTCS